MVETIMRRAAGETGEARRHAFAAILLERLPPHARMLEIGAGEGLLARALSAAGHDVIALDPQLRSTFPIVETTFEAYDAPAESFDCISAQMVLHHAGDLRAVLDKILTLLAPGGIVAIDDYAWERSRDEIYRRERSDLHRGEAMLAALRERFGELHYGEHDRVRAPDGDPALGFTFLGKKGVERG